MALYKEDKTTSSLTWPPVICRVKFKLCCIIHAIHHGRSPTYLTETVQVVGASRSRPRLRSSSTSQMDYALPWLCTKFRERAFSHAGPATWNALPDHIRTVADPVNFRRPLKTHYFRIVCNCFDLYIYNPPGHLYCTYVLLCNRCTINSHDI